VAASANQTAFAILSKCHLVARVVAGLHELVNTCLVWGVATIL
jgi:TM2 domain-containing membrane protein YozV